MKYNFLIRCFLIVSFVTLSSCNYKYVANFEKQRIKKIELKEKTFTSSDGYTIAYSDNEKFDKPILFFIHGHIFSQYTFYPIANKFRNDYRIILVDIPAFGKSSIFPDGDYTFDSQAKRFNELINFLKIDKINLVSTSLGGAIAIKLNSLSSKIKTSTLLAPFGMPLYKQELPEVIHHYFKTGEAAFHIDNPYDRSKMKKLIHYASNMPKFITPRFMHNEVEDILIKSREAINKLNHDVLYDRNSIVEIFKENPEYSPLAKEYGIILEDLPEDYNPLLDFINKNNDKIKIDKTDPYGNNYKTLVNELKSIKNPILVIWGDKDDIIHHKTMDTMKPLISDGTYKLYKKGSHTLFMLKSKKVAKDMKEFFLNLEN